MKERDLEGRNIVITGANTGIGRATAELLAQRGAAVTLACRSEEKTLPVVQAIRAAGGEADFTPLDLGSFDSVNACAVTLANRDAPIHVLINNAGVGGQRGLTESGFEIHFGINHIGHFLLTWRLLSKLQASAPSRVVVVASDAHYRTDMIPFDDMQKSTMSVSGFPEYCHSKLANVLYASELAHRVSAAGINVYCAHPGAVASDVWRRVPWPARPLIKMFMLSNEEGAQTSIYCATSQACADESGLYYAKSKVKTPSKQAQDPGLARELWERTELWVASA